MELAAFVLPSIHIPNCRKERNRENNREFFEFALKTFSLCPKSANFAFEQGINREFCGNLPKPASILDLAPFAPGCKKLSGN
jgi:hypothetical protein